MTSRPRELPASCKVLALHLTRPSNSEAKVLGELLYHLDADIRVHLVLNRGGDRDPSSRLHSLSEHTGIEVESLNVGLPADPGAQRFLALRLLSRSLHRLRRERVVQIARSLGVDAVYTSQQRFDCQLGGLISRRLKIPHIIHLHYVPGPSLRRPAMARLVCCEKVIAISDFICQKAIESGVARDRISVVHNSLDISQPPVQRPIDGTIVIGQIGRMHPVKGFLDTVEAFSRVHTRRPDTSLLLVGDGEERPAVEREVARLGLVDVVRLVGWQEDVGEWLSKLDIFVHPARAEPFGLAVLEAMARGISVVAYGDGGVAEIIEDGISGALVEPGDIDALACAVERFASDRSLRQRIGEEARERVSTAFVPAVAAKEFSAVLRSVAAK